MKSYMLLHYNRKGTDWFESDEIPNLRARQHQLNYVASECVLLKLENCVYIPTVLVVQCYCNVPALLKDLNTYMSFYLSLKGNLPANFPTSIKLF